MIYWRAGLLLTGLALLFGAAFLLRETGGAGWFPGCLLRRYTGIECPGCGMTRASHAALNGEFIRAFWFNPVGVILLPIAGSIFCAQTIAWVFNKKLPLRFLHNRWLGIAVVVIVIGWGILRNFL